MCLMYKERVLHSEETPLKIYYTDRQVCRWLLTSREKRERNEADGQLEFLLSGAFWEWQELHINSVVRQLHEQERMWSWSIRKLIRGLCDIWAASISAMPKNGYR